MSVDKGRVHHRLKNLEKVKTWQLVILLIIAGFISASLLRINNVGMVERREAVLSADEQGDIDTITARLYDLQTYVSSHMNTDLGDGVYLEKTYNRALEDWQEEQYSNNPNGNIFAEAQAVCAPQFSSWSTSYVQCVANELAKYPSADEFASDTSKPRQEAYIYNYDSPLWSADFAGWSLLIPLAIIILIITRLIMLGVLHILLRRHYRSL